MTKFEFVEIGIRNFKTRAIKLVFERHLISENQNLVQMGITIHAQYNNLAGVTNEKVLINENLNLFLYLYLVSLDRFDKVSTNYNERVLI